MITHLQTTWHSPKPFVYRLNHQSQPKAILSFAEFWQRVAWRFCFLMNHPACDVVLWFEESDVFFIWLWACVLANKNVILPPALTPALQQQFSKQGCLFASQLPADLHIEQAIDKDIDKLDIDWQKQLHRNAVCFFTSGSTGTPKAIKRTLYQLLLEGWQVSQSFDLKEPFIVFASVSHQHLYGLTFALLLPFMSGQSLFYRQLSYPEQIQHHLQSHHQHYPTLSALVISSPALLERCAGLYDFALAYRVFSSGGKLAIGVASHYPQGITEIYGSSETGMIAHRHHHKESSHSLMWQILPDVLVQVVDGVLWVKSDRTLNKDWVNTQDLVDTQGLVDAQDLATVSQQGFVLLGRADRIVKLEEKRLSLDEIETAIATLPDVQECCALVLEYQKRLFLSVAVVPNELGKQQLKQGKKPLLAKLKAQLADKLEPIAIPKHWRFVDCLPRNSQSKLDKAWLQALFLDDRYPLVLAQTQDEQTATYRLQFLPELTCFKGHFDEFAIYPAVGQIAFVHHFAKMAWSQLGYPCALEQLKFQSPIRPYDVLNLSLQYKDGKVFFVLTKDQTTVATGRIVYKVAF